MRRGTAVSVVDRSLCRDSHFARLVPWRALQRDLLAFEQLALQADHPAQFDHSADLGGVAREIIIEAVVSKFSQKQARGFPLDGVADVVRILSVDDHGRLLDEVNGMGSSIEG